MRCIHLPHAVGEYARRAGGGRAIARKGPRCGFRAPRGPSVRCVATSPSVMGRMKGLRAHTEAFATSARITLAVALAEPTTPGTPAPGWVPAPTT